MLETRFYLLGNVTPRNVTPRNVTPRNVTLRLEMYGSIETSTLHHK
jgi:hypothetical protein